MRATSVVSAGQRHRAAGRDQVQGFISSASKEQHVLDKYTFNDTEANQLQVFISVSRVCAYFSFISFIYTAFKYLSWWWILFYTHVDKEKKKVIVHHLGPVSSTSQKQSPLYSRAEWFLCIIRHLVESCRYCYDMFKYRREISKNQWRIIHDVHEI